MGIGSPKVVMSAKPTLIVSSLPEPLLPATDMVPVLARAVCSSASVIESS